MTKTIYIWILTFFMLTIAPYAHAQQTAKIPHIGFQLDAPISATVARIEGFRQGLRELGYIEGKNIIIEWRSSEGKVERRSELAAELVQLKVDILIPIFRFAVESFVSFPQRKSC